MKYLQNASSLFIGLVLTICATSASYSVAQDLAELTDSLGQNMAAQNWDAADSGYEGLYTAYQNEYGVGSGQALSMAKALGDWKIQAYRNNLLSGDSEQLINETSEFFSMLIGEIQEQQGDNASDLIDPLYGQAMVEYHLLQVATRRPVSDYSGIGPEIALEEICVDTEDRGGAVQCDLQEVPSRDYLDSQAFAKNEETAMHWDAIGASLARVAEVCKQNQYLLDEAEALAHLGDYQLYRDEQSAALANYNNAYQLLITNADPDAVAWTQRLFEAPTVVPSLLTSFPGANPTSITTHGMRFGFDINAEGKAEDVEVLSGASRNNRAEQNTTMGIISGATFRPHFDENGVVDSASVEI